MGCRKERVIGKIARKQLRASSLDLALKWQSFRGNKSLTTSRKPKRVTREVSQVSFARENYSINTTQPEDPSTRRRTKTPAI